MAERLRIAVADDEADIRQYFERLLPRLGHEVVAVAENGRQLVDLCRSARPDLIITDIKMPEMDGLEAARQIGNDHPIPVIVVSSHDRPTDLEEQDNVVDFLVKPVKAGQLQSSIAKATENTCQSDCG